MTRKTFITLALGLGLSFGGIHAAFAGGGGSGVGNGGEVVALGDGWRLADPYVVPADNGDMIHYPDFNPNIRNELEIVGRLLVRLGAAVDQTLPPSPPGSPPLTNNEQVEELKRAQLARELSMTAQARFVTEYVADLNVNYHFVDQLPSFCNSPAVVVVPTPTPAPAPSPTASPYPDPSPSSSPAELAGCTQGSDTYFLTDVFTNMPVRNGDPTDPRDQVEFIIHERLHAIDTVGEQPTYIADVTNGVETLVELHRAELAGQRPVLTDAQMTTLRTLIERIGYTYNRLTADGSQKSEEFEDGGEWNISPNGGGLYTTNAQLAPDSYLGIGSLLSDGGSLASGAEMVDSSCYLVSCVLGPGASLVTSSIAPHVSARPGSAQEAAAGEYEDELFTAVLGSQAKVNGTTLLLDSLQVMTPAPTSPTNQVTIGAGATMQTVQISASTGVSVGAGAMLLNDSLSFDVEDDANTQVTFDNQATVSSLIVPVIRASLLSGATARSIEFTAANAMDFPSAALCASPLLPTVSTAVTIGSVTAFSGICANALPVPAP